MEIIKTDYPRANYFGEVFPKRMIVLHHTVSSNAKSPMDTFRQGKQKIGVAYVIDKAGIIYELFPPEFWAYHIGGRSRYPHNRASIGIELVNEGILFKKDGKFNWTFGEYKGEVFEHDVDWRGSKYFAPYPEAQVLACAELVKKLCKEFTGILSNVLTNYCCKEEYLDNYNGVLSHHNLRGDKSDVSVAFDLKRFQNLIK